MKILLAEDDAVAGRTLTAILTAQGHEVTAVDNGIDAWALWQVSQPRVVVSDWLMPAMDGIELCRRIRAVSKVPIVVLSVKAGERAKVEALDAGADDYLTKPFGTDELLARVRAALRRTTDDTGDVAPLEVGDFRIDLQARRVHVRGHQVRLTPKEFDLFVYLARRPNRVIEHRRLLGAVWGETAQDRTEYLRVFVGQLRKKLEEDPSEPRHLATEPWIGYRFNPSA